YAVLVLLFSYFFFSSRRRHTRSKRDWSSDVCSSDLIRYRRRVAAMDSSAFDTQSGGASPPSALLIDFGGVLTSSVLDAFRSLSVDLGLAPETALNVLSSNEEARTALIEHEVGRVAEEEFEEAFAAALTEAGVRVESQGLLARFDAYLDLEESMIETVMEVRRRGVPVALVSNSLGRDCYARID